jgi:cupin superfamily acireductone dioxygenase involved in methionine salvage
VYVEVLNITAGSDKRSEILEKLWRLYPHQVDELKKYFIDFSDNFLILFQQTREFTLKGDLKDPDDLLLFMENLLHKLDLRLNHTQLKQVRDAVLIFLDHKPLEESK